MVLPCIYISPAITHLVEVPSSPPGSFLPTRVTPRIPPMARPKKQIWRGVIRLKLLSSSPGIAFMEKMIKTWSDKPWIFKTAPHGEVLFPYFSNIPSICSWFLVKNQLNHGKSQCLMVQLASGNPVRCYGKFGPWWFSVAMLFRPPFLLAEFTYVHWLPSVQLTWMWDDRSFSYRKTMAFPHLSKVYIPFKSPFSLVKSQELRIFLVEAFG